MTDKTFYPDVWKGEVPEDFVGLQDKGLVIKLGFINNLEYFSHLSYERIIPFKEMTILNFGCGTGERLLESALTYKDTKFIVTDPFNEALDRTKEYTEALGLSNVFFLDYDEFLSDYDENIFEFITSTRPIQHFEEVDTLLEKVSSLLKERGTMLLTNWTGENPEEIIFDYQKDIRFGQDVNQEDLLDFFDFLDEKTDNYSKKETQSVLGMKNTLSDYGLDLVDGLYHANYRIKNYCKNVPEEQFESLSILKNAVYSEQFYRNFLAHFLLFKRKENDLQMPDLNSDNVKKIIPFISPFYGYAKKDGRHLLGLKHQFLNLNEGIELEDLSLPEKYAKIFFLIDAKKNLERIHRRVLPMPWDEFLMVIKAMVDQDLIYLHR